MFACLAALAGGIPGRAAEGRAQESAQALLARAIAGQHHADAALAEFERLERKQLRSKGRVSEDRTYRVVPTGTGTLRLVRETNGQAVAPEFYRKQLRELEQALVWALTPAESKQRQRVEKFQRRQKERRELVEAVGRAFLATRLGEETRGGRSVVKLQLDPNPDFKPKTRMEELFTRVRATAWVDAASGQMARLEAEVTSDISFFGGIAGKIFRGSRVLIEQSEAAPGIWLPVRYETNITGRRFVFGFELRESILIRNYARIGAPQQALAAVRRELTAASASPGNGEAPR